MKYILSITKVTFAMYLSRVFTSPFFQNKFVLYGSLLLVLLSILRHLANRNVNAVVLMALIGLVMSNFSKNMIVVLLTAVISVFLLEMLDSQGVMEGMKTKEDAAKNSDDANEKDEDDGDSEKSDDKKADDKKADDKKASNKIKEKNTPMNKNKTKKAPAKTEKQGMTKLAPAKYNEGADDDDDDESGGVKGNSANRIDYASTLEQAYDNIENIIGEEGVRGLTDQTKSLMNQQKELMNNMKDMGPLLKSAEDFMKQITGNGGIGGITQMLKGFATPAANK